MKRYWLVLGVVGLLASGCKKDESSPVAQPPAAQPPTTTPTPPGSTSFIIYSDDLESGGGAFLYPGGDNQGLSFSETTNPSVGTKCIRYSWNGGDTAGQHVFVGMDLMHVGDLSNYASTPGKDLRAGAYTHVMFDARGTLGANVVIKIEVADDGNTMTPAPCIVLSTSGMDDDGTPGNAASCSNLAPLLTTWQRFNLPVTSNNLASVKDFFKATYIYKLPPATTGTGGTVFFDQIVYVP